MLLIHKMFMNVVTVNKNKVQLHIICEVYIITCDMKNVSYRYQFYKMTI